ncbi:Uncharacterised protein [uncultured archaeon]|nr:Uncharacterised protein [uncultured archaeon]
MMTSTTTKVSANTPQEMNILITNLNATKHAKVFNIENLQQTDQSVCSILLSQLCHQAKQLLIYFSRPTFIKLSATNAELLRVLA